MCMKESNTSLSSCVQKGGQEKELESSQMPSEPGGTHFPAGLLPFASSPEASGKSPPKHGILCTVFKCPVITQ